MAQYRKKPVVIDAVRWTHDGGGEFVEWLTEAIKSGVVFLDPVATGFPSANVQTLEGVMRVGVGDWIIRGVKGELYPIKDDIFRETYDPV